MAITEINEAQDLAGAVARVQQRIAAEPAHRMVLYKMLLLCETVRSAAEIERAVLGWPEMKVATQTPKIVLTWLVQSGGIEQIKSENQSIGWLTTPAGREVIRIENPMNRLNRLLAREPAYRGIYLRVLQACITPQTRAAIDAMLQDEPLLNHPRVYASYFLEALEQANGVEWNNGWRITRSGIKIINENK